MPAACTCPRCDTLRIVDRYPGSRVRAAYWADIRATVKRLAFLLDDDLTAGF